MFILKSQKVENFLRFEPLKPQKYYLGLSLKINLTICYGINLTIYLKIQSSSNLQINFRTFLRFEPQNNHQNFS